MIGRHDDAGPSGSGYQRDLSFTLTKTDIHGVAYVPELARCVATREGSSQDFETTTMVATSFAWQSSFCDTGSDDISGTLVKNQIMGVLTHSADIAPTLGKESYSPMKASSGQALDFAVATASAVRRLTPRECERLQGFPDDYTLIPYRNGMAADGPRYKALGNSWATTKFRWLGERIQRLMPPVAANDNKQDITRAA